MMGFASAQPILQTRRKRAPALEKLPDQLQDNLASVELKLTQDELKQLDGVSSLPPEYPGWMLPFQGSDRLAPVDRWALLRKTDKVS